LALNVGSQQWLSALAPSVVGSPGGGAIQAPGRSARPAMAAATQGPNFDMDNPVRLPEARRRQQRA